jgi:dolichol-phosphate mannosyltransferase
MTKPVVSVVMPAFNERASLRVVVEAVTAALDGWSHEIVVVDDGSSDGTWEEIQGIRRDHPRVCGIRLTRNFGHQAALGAGLRAARGDAVVMMDADGQHPPELVPALVRLWEEGHPVVQAVRQESAREGRLKASTSRLFYRVWSALSGVHIVRGASDFRLLDRRVLDTVLRMGGSLTFLRGLIHWLGFDIRNLDYEVRPRIGGRSSYTWRRMLAFSIDGFTAFSIVPLRVAMALGMTVSAVSFAYLCYVLMVWLWSDRVVSGWASTAGLVALIGGIQLLTIGVLGEYVGRVFLRTTDRPEFVVAESTGRLAASSRISEAS